MFLQIILRGGFYKLFCKAAAFGVRSVFRFIMQFCLVFCVLSIFVCKGDNPL